MSETNIWREVREAFGYKNVPKTRVRYEDLPGKLVFPGIDPEIRMHYDGKFSYLNGPKCDEVRNFTYEEQERFRTMGGVITLPFGVDFSNRAQGELVELNGSLFPLEGQGMFTEGVILRNFVFIDNE